MNVPIGTMLMYSGPPSTVVTVEDVGGVGVTISSGGPSENLAVADQGLTESDIEDILKILEAPNPAT